MTTFNLNCFKEIYIIKNILEYADLGLDLFYNESKKIFYLKLNPQNKKFSAVDKFFSQIILSYNKCVLNVFNTHITFIFSELIIPNRKPMTISFKKIDEKEKNLIHKCKIHYREYSVEI